MPRFKTTFNGYSVKFSPFIEGRLAVATAQNFGIIGNGRLHILEVGDAVALLPGPHWTADRAYGFTALPPFSISLLVVRDQLH